MYLLGTEEATKRKMVYLLAFAQERDKLIMCCASETMVKDLIAQNSGEVRQS